MRNWNEKRITVSKEQRSDALQLAEILLRNGYDVFMWDCEGNVTVEFEYHDPEYTSNEYVYIDHEHEYVGNYAYDEVNEMDVRHDD